jgi:hypothetical protein
MQVMLHLNACSISRSTYETLEREPFTASALAVFNHACDLVTPDGGVLALVTPHVSDGPLNIVLDAEPGDFASFAPGLVVTKQGPSLQAGKSRIVLNGAKMWEPCPDWNTLRNRQAVLASRLPMLQAAALRQAPAESRLVSEETYAGGPNGILFHMREVIPILQTGWSGDMLQLRAGATRLAGLGNGLTPAGDDFLIGVMLWAWAAHPKPEQFCRVIVKAAAPRTTTLSAAFLRSAANGECSAAWHGLLAALTEKDDDLTTSVQQVLAHGATSGADTLAGFLCAARFSGA